MNRTLIYRFIILILAFTFATSYLSDALIEYQINGLTAEYLDYESKFILDTLDLTLNPFINEGDYESISNTIMSIGENPTIDHLILRNSEGEIIASYPSGIQNTDFSNNLNDKNTSGIQRVKKIPIEIDQGKAQMYELEVQLSAAYESAVSNLIQRQIMLIYLAMQAVMIIGIIMIFYRLISNPISRLSVAAEQVKHSNYKIRIKSESDDEIGHLAKTFNEMTESIEQHMEALKTAREKTEIAADAKMKFLANMSHEIRTPLNSILGFSDLLYDMENDIEKRAHLDIIRTSGDHLLAIINDILDFSKLETESLTLEIAPFTMRSNIYDIAKMFEMDLKRKGLKFSLEVSESVPRILKGDALRIKQVIINLLSNAVKFTNEGKIILYISYDSGMVVIKISDTGIGMTLEQQNHVFESFTQADYSITRLYGGTGLGLAISKKLIESMRGQIALYSELGKGTTVSICLPLKAVENNIYALFGGEVMVKNWLGTDILIYDLVLNAIKELPVHIGRLEEAVEAGNTHEVFRLAHALKGLTGNFHMYEIYQPASELCEYVRRESDAVDPSRVRSMFEDIKEVIGYIPEYYMNETVAITDIAAEDAHLDSKILVAEDVFENWLLMKFFLKNITSHIDHAENGMKALEMLDLKKYDLLLLDMQMPYVSGDEIIKIIKDQPEFKDLRIIIVTANASKTETDEYLKLGCDYVIPKPVKRDLLQQKVLEILMEKHT